MPTSDGFETPPATVTWCTQPDGGLCARLVGEVDALNRVEILDGIATRLSAERSRSVHIDLGELAFCDARTLVGLTELVRGARAVGASVALTSVPPHLQRILALVAGDPEPPGPAPR